LLLFVADIKRSLPKVCGKIRFPLATRLKHYPKADVTDTPQPTIFGQRRTYCFISFSRPEIVDKISMPGNVIVDRAD
jgi:hypothetical protein